MPLPAMPTRHPKTDPRAGTGSTYDPQRGGWYPTSETPAPSGADERG